MKTTAIIKILTTLDEAIAECLALLGEGANPDYTVQEEAFKRYNTPVVNGYCRVVCDEHIATALQYFIDAGITSEHVQVIKVEWLGQDRIIETQLFQTGEDEEGNPIYLGRISA
jgi:hypothetical protein